MEARRLTQYVHPQNGTVEVIHETNHTYTVEHSDLYRVYSRVTGFRKFKTANAEARCLAGKD